MLTCQYSEDSVAGWTPVSGRTGNVTTVDLLLSPEQINLIESFLTSNNIKYRIVLHDLQRVIGDKVKLHYTKTITISFSRC